MLLLIAGIAMAAVMLGVAMAANGASAGMVLVAVAVAILIWAYRSDRSLKREKEQAEYAADHQRIQALAARMDAPEFRLEIEGSTGWMASFATLIVAAAMLTWAWPERSIGLFVLGVLVGTLGLVILAMTLSSVGKPVLILDHRGIRSPLSRLIPWDAIDGIHLQENSHRGIVFSHTLMFNVPSLANMAGRFALAFRLLFKLRFAPGKRNFFVVLNRTSESPRVVYKIARQLWTRHTGRQHEWNPNFSVDTNRALREMDESARALDRMRTATPHASTERLREFDRLISANQVVTGEVKSKLGVVRWLSVISVLLFLTYLAAMIAKLVVR